MIQYSNIERVEEARENFTCASRSASENGAISKNQMSSGNFWGINVKKSALSIIMAFAVLSTTHGQVENLTSDNQQMIVPGKGVSQELLTEFQRILDKCLEKKDEMPSLFAPLSNLTENSGNVCKAGESSDDKFYKLSEDEQNRMYIIYVQMDEKQRKEQEIVFISPILSSPYSVFPKHHSPLSPHLKLWKDPSQFSKGRDNQKFEIWIDGVKVDNNVLNSYTATDFSGYFVSVLEATEKINQFRVDLWTKTGYDDFCQKYFDKPISIDKLLEIKPRIGFFTQRDKDSREKDADEKNYAFSFYENIILQDGSTLHSFMMFRSKE